MAHMVKCKECGQLFDRDTVPNIQIGRRYAHKTCAEGKEEILLREEADKKALYDYILQLFKMEQVEAKIPLQIERYVKEYNYTYSGILKALIYYYDIRKNSIENSNYGIGIVPYIYDEAYRYYYKLWEAQNKNQNKNISLYKPKEKIIVIEPPKRKPHKKNLFSFLDEEENNGK